MGAKSKENGEKGETIVKDAFRAKGYWVHVIKRNNSGSQPLDVIAIKGTDDGIDAWLLDVKYVEKGKRFSFDDVQPNQVESMAYIRKRIGRSAKVGFAIVFAESIAEGICFLPYEDYVNMKDDGEKSVNADFFIGKITY